jgi:CheY-like chemotaxis protein
VTLTSRPGEGSEFVVRLPAGLAPADVPTPTPGLAAMADGAAERPLAAVFERDDAARRLLADAARAAGLATLEVEQPEGLGSVVRESSPDVLVFGQIAGGENLDPELTALRRDPASAALPIVFAGSAALVEQALQIGVTDTVAYPLDRAAVARTLRAITRRPEAGCPRVAVIMDDNPTYAEALTRILATRGVRSLHARDGAEGLELARRHSPDLILLDLMMPRVNGWQVLRDLAADETTRHIPVVVLTVKPLGDDERRDLESRCRGVVSKAHFSRGELWDVLDSLALAPTEGD